MAGWFGKRDPEEFESLFAELEDIELRRTGSGRFFSERDASRWAEIERRLVALVSTDVSAKERRRHVRVPCDLWVEVHGPAGTGPGVVADIGAGGAFVETELAVRRGEEVRLVIERQPGLFEHGLDVRARVAWTGEEFDPPRRGFGVAFAADDPAATHRVRRFVLTLLRKRLADFG